MSNQGIIDSQKLSTQSNGGRITSVIGVEKIKTSKSYNRFVGRPVLEQSNYLKDLGQYEENAQSQ